MFREFFSWLGSFIINGLANLSYWICLYIALGGVLATICGFKKGGRYSTFSVCIYSILQAFSAAIK